MRRLKMITVLSNSGGKERQGDYPHVADVQQGSLLVFLFCHCLVVGQSCYVFSSMACFHTSFRSIPASNEFLQKFFSLSNPIVFKLFLKLCTKWSIRNRPCCVFGAITRQSQLTCSLQTEKAHLQQHSNHLVGRTFVCAVQFSSNA